MAIKYAGWGITNKNVHPDIVSAFAHEVSALSKIAGLAIHSPGWPLNAPDGPLYRRTGAGWLKKHAGWGTTNQIMHPDIVTAFAHELSALSKIAGLAIHSPGWPLNAPDEPLYRRTSAGWLKNMPDGILRTKICTRIWYPHLRMNYPHYLR